MNDAILAAAAATKKELTQADAARLDRLLNLADPEGRVKLDAALRTLYPKYALDPAQAQLRKLRKEIKDAAEIAGTGLALESDKQTRAKPRDRWLTFHIENQSPSRTENPARFAVRQLTERPPLQA